MLVGGLKGHFVNTVKPPQEDPALTVLENVLVLENTREMITEATNDTGCTTTVDSATESGVSASTHCMITPNIAGSFYLCVHKTLRGKCSVLKPYYIISCFIHHVPVAVQLDFWYCTLHLPPHKLLQSCDNFFRLVAFHSNLSVTMGHNSHRMNLELS